MARITVDDCLDHVDNRFNLVLLAAKRARSLATQGADALVPEENDKMTVVALREIAAGKVTEATMAKPKPEEIAAAAMMGDDEDESEPKDKPEASSGDGIT